MNRGNEGLAYIWAACLSAYARQHAWKPCIGFDLKDKGI